jgi:hypothetical protein
MNQKTLNILYGIVLVILVVIVVHFSIGRWSEQLTQHPSPTPTQATNSPKFNPTPTPTPTNPLANWKTYTSPTFGYSIKYPAIWKEKQGRVFETGVSEDRMNMAIEFYNSGILMLQIATDYKTKVGDPSLLSLASEASPPIDKTIISGVVAYKIGNLDGYRRLVTISDPASQGLGYITKDSKYIYHMSTFENTESTEIVNMLKTFSTNQL